MSVASSSLVNPSRNNSLMVRLAPYLVEAVCELTRAVRDKTHAQTEVSGLLYGTAEEGIVTVEALKTFKDTGPGSDLARRERMEKAFEATMTQAQNDPEFASYKNLGWFSLRGSGGLISSDVEFHNRHFKNPEDVAFVVWRDGDTQVTAELYARAEGGKLTSEDYRWSSVRLSTELRRVSQPVDLVMRLRLNEDSYLRTYAASEKNERRDEWKKIAATAKRTMLSMLPGRGRPDEYRDGDLDRPAPSNARALNQPSDSRTLFRNNEQAPVLPVEQPAPPPERLAPAALVAAAALSNEAVAAPLPGMPAAPAVAAAMNQAAAPFDAGRMARQQQPPEIGGLPMVINRKPPPKPVPWLSMALVFILFSGVTFAVLALKGIGSGSGKLSQIMQVLFPGTDLELRAEGRGDRLLLTWNRKNAMVQSASSAVLSISDGAQHFEKRLDAAQVADGSVLYKPTSGDVTLRLQVIGSDQGVAVASLRVLDATNPASTNGPTLDLTAPGALGSSLPATNAPAQLAPRVAESGDAPTREAAGNNRRTNRQPVSTVPVENRSASVPRSPGPAPSQPQKQPLETAKVAAPLPLATPPAPAPQQQPVQMANAPPAVNPPAVAKFSPPPQQQPATRTSQATPETSGSEIKGWDPNISENKASPAGSQGETQAQQAAAAADARTAFIGPKVLLQVMPSTRSLTPGSVLQTTRVEVQVVVDTNGHVRSAHLLNNNFKSQLGSAALSAAKQWTFQPATLRGQRVDSDHTIVFEFRPEVR